MYRALVSPKMSGSHIYTIRQNGDIYREENTNIKTLCWILIA
jgi:hypothetical protein